MGKQTCVNTHTGRSGSGWKSTPWASGSRQGIAEGGTVGLLLRRGSLSVHIGGRQVGVMRTGLSGALVWAADLLGDRPGAMDIVAQRLEA